MVQRPALASSHGVISVLRVKFTALSLYPIISVVPLSATTDLQTEGQCGYSDPRSQTMNDTIIRIRGVLTGLVSLQPVPEMRGGVEGLTGSLVT